MPPSLCILSVTLSTAHTRRLPWLVAGLPFMDAVSRDPGEDQPQGRRRGGHTRRSAHSPAGMLLPQISRSGKVPCTASMCIDAFSCSRTLLSAMSRRPASDLAGIDNGATLKMPGLGRAGATRVWRARGAGGPAAAGVAGRMTPKVTSSACACTGYVLSGCGSLHAQV